MKTHFVKCHPEPYGAVARGEKLHEFRKNDRNYEVGDTVVQQCWDPAKEAFTGHEAWFEITYLSKGPDWGIPEGYVVFTIKRRPSSLLQSLQAHR